MTSTATPLFPAQAAATELPVLDMVQPLLGFPEHRRFALTRLDEIGMFCELRSLEQADLRFVVVPPAMFFPDYAPEIDDDLSETLGVRDASDLVVLSLVTLGQTPQEATANLLAPVLVNHRNRRAAQVLLADVDLPLRAPLTGR